MDNLGKFLEDLDRRRQELATVFRIDELKTEIEVLRQQREAPDFWQDQERAVIVNRRAEDLQKNYQRWLSLEQSLAETKELAQMATSEKDNKLLAELSDQSLKLSADLAELEKLSLYTGAYDESNALLSVNAGTGGVDAQDWAEMLLRMYTRWAERNGFNLEIINTSYGDEAGIKSATFIVKGDFAYGYMKAERGVHRLVRISPFDAAHRRHTSFALVDVIPDIGNEIEVEIKVEDLKIDTFRASGPGGQYVNKTESAIRITHIPTGIVVECQSERSQYQNRETAMRILKAKLFALEKEKREKEVQTLKGERKDIAWGNQIRSYVLHPYTLVKDHRTGVEVGNIQAVLDGDIDVFISAYLKSMMLISK